MKSLQSLVCEATNQWFVSPNYDVTGEEAYNQFVSEAIDTLNKFDFSIAYAYADYPDGFKEYSRKAKTSLKTAGKKCAKLLEKIIKPKFMGKVTTPIKQLEQEFYEKAGAFFVEEAWEWAPGGDTDLMAGYWDNYTFFRELEFYFGEIDEDEYEEYTRRY